MIQRVKNFAGTMGSTRLQPVIIVAALTLVAAMLACSGGTLLGRKAQPTSTPTKAPRPIWTVTLTPAHILMPTSTPVPTDTPPPPTDTPLPTSTPLPPTDTPLPTATSPPPTHTPTSEPPSAWTGQIDNQQQDCTQTRVFGSTLERDGTLLGDIWVHLWTDGSEGVWARSLGTDLGTGNWDIVIDDAQAREGVWHVCVVPSQGSWDCISNIVDAATSSDCNTGTQVVHITFRKQ